MKCIVTCKFDKDSNAAATVRCKPNSREQNARMIIPGKFKTLNLKERVILDLVENVFFLKFSLIKNLKFEQTSSKTDNYAEKDVRKRNSLNSSDQELLKKIATRKIDSEKILT